MDKPFFTYDEQIKKLKNKGLNICDENFAREKLKEVGYYHLITGYKDLFRNNTVKKYKYGVDFKDIYSLYTFDRDLRELFFKYLQIVERTLGSHISYYFCEKYGNNQLAYLDQNNYNNITRNMAHINKLIGILNKLANQSSGYKYIMYYQNKYGNVPLWILINAVTFGSKSKMYDLLESDIQSKISKEYYGLNESTLRQTIKFVTKFRNVCAHGNRLYNYKSNENMPDTIIHHKLLIPKIGSQYIHGKKDLFGLVIAFRYLLSKNDFSNFKYALDKLIRHLLSDTSFITEKDILEQMGFPLNWKRITLFRNY